ncbi:MAG TPA: hypothetical protein VIU61_24820 [Kofleriaceae bacterium]
MRTWLCLLTAIALAACGGKKDPPATGSGTGSGSPTPAAPTGIEVFVNDTSVVKISPDQITSWPRLDSLLPEDAQRLGTWQVVYITGADPKPAELNNPSSSYPQMVPALFPGEGNLPAFGMFDPIELMKHGKPGLRQDRVREIRIKMSKDGRGGDHQGGAASTDPSKLVLTIKTDDGDKQLTGTQILALPVETMPGNDDNKGWKLTKLLAAAGAPAKYAQLVLTDAAGANLVISKKDFDDTTMIPFVKLNRQGSLRFRMMKKQGEGWNATSDLRALTSVKVVK